jgi:hypothetical protein
MSKQDQKVQIGWQKLNSSFIMKVMSHWKNHFTMWKRLIKDVMWWKPAITMTIQKDLIKEESIAIWMEKPKRSQFGISSSFFKE